MCGIAGIYSDAWVNQGIALLLNATSQVEASVANGSQTAVVTAPAALTTGDSYMIGFTYDGTQVTLYENGQPSGTAAALAGNAAYKPDRTPFLLGAYGVGGGTAAKAFLPATLKDAFVLPTALTGAEWEALYTAGTTLP